MAVGRWKRWPLVDGRWPKEAMADGKRSIGGRPLLWPVTYVRRLNQTNQKIFVNKKAFLRLTKFLYLAFLARNFA
jgi:hypothetical protein